MELPTAWQIFTDLGRDLSVLMIEEKKPVYSCEPALDEKKVLLTHTIWEAFNNLI